MIDVVDMTISIQFILFFKTIKFCEKHSWNTKMSGFSNLVKLSNLS